MEKKKELHPKDKNFPSNSYSIQQLIGKIQYEYQERGESLSVYLWKLFFMEKTNNSFIQLFRYVFVGGLATCFDFLTLFLFTEFAGLHYLVSAGLGFAVGLTINYFLSLLWIFTNRNISNRKLEFTIYAIIGMIGLALTELSIWFFTDFFGFHYLVSKIFSTLLILLFNFGMRKMLLFR